MEINRNETNHVFIKQNLVTISDGKRMYDIFKCEKCGLVGKSYTLNTIRFDGRINPKRINNCPFQKQSKKIKITDCRAVGEVFANLTSGSVHEVIDHPDGKDNSRGIWVMGVGEPVKVLFGEFEEIE